MYLSWGPLFLLPTPLFLEDWLLHLVEQPV